MRLGAINTRKALFEGKNAMYVTFVVGHWFNNSTVMSELFPLAQRYRLERHQWKWTMAFFSPQPIAFAHVPISLTVLLKQLFSTFFKLQTPLGRCQFLAVTWGFFGYRRIIEWFSCCKELGDHRRAGLFLGCIPVWTLWVYLVNCVGVFTPITEYCMGPGNAIQDLVAAPCSNTSLSLWEERNI